LPQPSVWLTWTFREGQGRTTDQTDILEFTTGSPIPHARAPLSQIQDAAYGAGTAGCAHTQPIHEEPDHHVRHRRCCTDPRGTAG
jgi:hypothetical protein